MKSKKNKQAVRKNKLRSKSHKNKKNKTKKNKKGGSIPDEKDIFIEKVANQSIIPSDSSNIPYGYTRDDLKDAFILKSFEEVGVDDLNILLQRISNKIKEEGQEHNKRISNLNKLKNHINLLIIKMNRSSNNQSYPNLMNLSFPSIRTTESPELSPITTTNNDNSLHLSDLQYSPDSSLFSRLNRDTLLDAPEQDMELSSNSRRRRRTPPPFPNTNSF